MLSHLLDLIFSKRRAEFTGHYDRAERTRTYDVDSKPRRLQLGLRWNKTDLLRKIPPPHCLEPEHPAPCNRRICATCSHSSLNENQHLICSHYWSLVQPGDTCPDWDRALCDGCSGPAFPELGTLHPKLPVRRDVFTWLPPE